jgi:catechol 2,3-dioxygenase-like lactoylglutathione lyase family enzyme
LAEGRGRIRGLEHLLVLTDDLEATRTFWCEALGLEVGGRPELPFPGYWLYAGGTPCVHLAERAAYETHAAALGLAPATGPVDHVALAAEGFDAIARRLAAAGIEVVPNEIPEAGIRQLFVTDPNGVRVELNVRAG